MHLQLKFSLLSGALLALALKPKVKFCMQRSVAVQGTGEQANEFYQVFTRNGYEIRPEGYQPDATDPARGVFRFSVLSSPIDIENVHRVVREVGLTLVSGNA